MDKFILFNEDEEYLEFLFAKDVAKYLNIQEVNVHNCIYEQNKVNGYYIEKEEDKIVQYHFKQPIKIWDDLTVMCDTLLVHPEAVKKSLRAINCISALHFKYFNFTKGRPL